MTPDKANASRETSNEPQYKKGVLYISNRSHGWVFKVVVLNTPFSIIGGYHLTKEDALAGGIEAADMFDIQIDKVNE